VDAGGAKMKNKLQQRKRNVGNINLTYDQADLDSGLDEGSGSRFKVGNNNSRGEYT
jgi:hypothetical protein